MAVITPARRPTPQVPAAANRRAWVLYDGQCPLCQRSVAILRRLDWLGRLQFQDARQVDRLPRTLPPLDSERLLDEMHVVTPAGRVFSGFAAFRWMAWRLPLTLGLAPLCYLPGIPWVGQRVYLWVAKNRYKLVPCKDGVCQVPPRS